MTEILLRHEVHRWTSSGGPNGYVHYIYRPVVKEETKYPGANWQNPHNQWYASGIFSVYTTVEIDAKVNPLQATNSDLQNKLTTAQNEISTLKSSLETALKKIETLDTLLGQTRATVKSHRDDFEKHQHDTAGAASGTPYY